MLYFYDKKNLIHRKLNFLKTAGYLAAGIGIVSVASYYTGINSSLDNMTEYERVIMIKKHDEFSQDKLVEMLKDLNVKFPHIVLAQAKTESGHFKSGIFFENNNLFGMKEAQRRITTAEGTNRNHAYYNHWRESVYDYAFYQCRYLSGIKSEADYFQYLGASYAEDTQYVSKLKNMVDKESLRKLFD
mgnify:FL=1|jgi:hypothetical protein